MSAVTIVQLPDEKRVLHALTVDQYHQMVADGILPEGEPFELIYGQVTRKDRGGDGAIESHRNPKVGTGQYAVVESFTPGQIIELPLTDGKVLPVQVQELLP